MTQQVQSFSIKNFSLEPPMWLTAGKGLIGGATVSHLILNTFPTVGQGALLGVGAYGIKTLLVPPNIEKNIHVIITSALATVMVAALFFAKNYPPLAAALNKFDLILSLDQGNKLTSLFLASIVVSSNMEGICSQLDQAFINKAILRAVNLNGLNIQYINLKMLESQKRKEVALVAVKKDGQNIQHIDLSLLEAQDRKEVAFAAVNTNPDAFTCIGKTLQSDYKLALNAVRKISSLIQFVNLESLSFEQRKKLAAISVEKDGLNIQHIDLSLLEAQDRKEVALVALNSNVRAFAHIGETLQGDYEVALRAVKSDGLNIQYVNSTLLNPNEYKTIAVEAVKQTNAALDYLPIPLQNEGEIILAIDGNNENLPIVCKVLRKIGSIHLVSEKLWTNLEVILAAIEGGCPVQYLYTLNCLSHLEAENLKKVALAAVNRDGSQLEYLKNFKDDKQVVEAAVEENGRALQFASRRLREQDDLVEKAVNNNGLALAFAPKFCELRQIQVDEDERIICAALKQNAFAIQFLTHLKADSDMVYLAVKYRGRALQFVPPLFRSNRKIVQKAVSQDGTAIEFADPDLINNSSQLNRSHRSAVVANQQFLPLSRESQQNSAYLPITVLATQSVNENSSFVGDNIPLIAVQQNGLALKQLVKLSPDLAADVDIVLAAIKQTEYAFNFVSSTLQTNDDFLLRAIEYNPRVLRLILEKEPQKSRDFILKAFRKTPEVIEFVSDTIKTDERFLSQASSINPDVINFYKQKAINSINQ
jgi:hypothetical protein